MPDRSREAILDRLRRAASPDVLVIGAGINGAAVFRDLAAQGVRVVIVDKGDIASGASAALSRMVHGGLRYLETAEFGLVHQALYERNLLLRNAPHLVAPLRTVVPLYSAWGGLAGALRKLVRRPTRSGRRGSVLVRIGLCLYDLLGRQARKMPRHRMLDRAAVLAAMPGLTPTVTAAAEYHDAWVAHPERLNLELILDGLAAGNACEALTYAAVEAGNGDTVTLRDAIDGAEVTLRPRVVINAAGPWIDRVNAPLGIGGRLIGGTKGSHLVLDHPQLLASLGDAMLWFEAEDGRTCIVFPFLGHVLLGTTDLRIDDPDAARCDESEVDYLFAVMRAVFPEIALSRAHVVFRYSGVRPLPHVDVGSPGLIPRSHSLPVREPSAPGGFPVYAMVGGKWTTFRGFGAEAADVVLRRLERGRRVDTRDLPIGGGLDFPTTRTARMAWIRAVAIASGLTEGRVATLLDRYGTRARSVAQGCGGSQDRPLASLPDHSRGEIAWILREEFVTQLDDLVLRRTLIAIRGEARAAALEELADIAAETLGWSSARRASELARMIERLRDRHGVSVDLPRDADAKPPVTETIRPAEDTRRAAR